MDIIKFINNHNLNKAKDSEIRFEKQYRKFNQIRTKFPETSKLPEKQKKLLHILETRSEANHGDTKIKNEILEKLIGVSRQQLNRYLLNLENLGYIARLSLPLHYTDSNNNIKIWKDRVIRCRRILLRYRFKFKRSLNWKRDPRPDFNIAKTVDEATGKIPHISWIIEALNVITDGFGNKYKAAWEWFPDLYKMNLLDPEQQEMFRDLKDKWETDQEHPIASVILGRKINFGGCN